MARHNAVLLLIYLLTAACGYGKAVIPPEPKGFVKHKASSSLGIITEQTPFQYVWRNPIGGPTRERIMREGTYSIFVEPVGTMYVEESMIDPWLKDQTLEIADYFYRSIIEHIRTTPGGAVKVQIADSPETADLILELQLTEVGLGLPPLYLATWIIPLPGIATAYDASYNSVLAVEAHLYETSTERVVAEMYDRRIPKIRLLDLKKVFSRMLPLQEIADDWAVEIARTLAIRVDSGEHAEGVADATLLPW